MSDLVQILDSAVQDPCHLIQVSSDSVYGSIGNQNNAQTAQRPRHEDDVVSPMSVYTASKYVESLKRSNMAVR